MGNPFVRFDEGEGYGPLYSIVYFYVGGKNLPCNERFSMNLSDLRNQKQP